MEHSEERPSKIRRLNSSVNHEPVTGNPINGIVGSTDNAVASIENNSTKFIPSTSTEKKPSLDTSTDGDMHETKASQPLSKNQLKKLLKKQTWEEGREYRKAKRREKEKQKKIRKAEARATTDLQSAEENPSVPDLSKRTSQRPVQLPVAFVLDCDFDDLMTEAELVSLGAQLTRCYSDNKSAPYRAHLIVSSFGGKLKHRFETVLASNHLGWKGVTFTGDDFVAAATEADNIMRSPQGGQLVGAFAGVTTDDLHRTRVLPAYGQEEIKYSALENPGNPSAAKTARKAKFEAGQSDVQGISKASAEQTDAGDVTSATNESGDISHHPRTKEGNEHPGSQSLEPQRIPSIVYLTSDSSQTLDVLSPYTTYVIGGIVDKNRHKGICYKRAMARAIPTARLPIGEYMTMQSRSVLTTNHVAEVMLRWLEYGDWAKAFLQVIPKRKDAKPKPKPEVNGGSKGEEDGYVSCGSQGG